MPPEAIGSPVLAGLERLSGAAGSTSPRMFPINAGIAAYRRGNGARGTGLILHDPVSFLSL
jgi:hypothetical protein